MCVVVIVVHSLVVSKGNTVGIKASALPSYPLLQYSSTSSLENPQLRQLMYPTHTTDSSFMV